MSKGRISSVVVALGVASLLTDMSSEMIYPLLPFFLTSVLGATVISIGVIEGLAETTAALLKALSGIWADKAARRKPFVVAGYGLAGLARPLIGLATGWPFVLAMRFTDRIGKGIRTSPRDALIVDAAGPDNRGRAFGFQRSMDHAGAVLGPLVAAGLLWLGFSHRAVFLWAFVPAALVMVVLIFWLHEPKRTLPVEKPKALKGHWQALGSNYRLFLLSLLVFTLGNSTDAFILLRLSDAGVPATWVAVLWSVHHVVKMSAAYWGGGLSDRIGRRKAVLMGWAIYGLIYLSFALFESLPAMIATFVIYGMYFGLCEPSERAWAVDLAPDHLRGTALGYYHATVGLGALPASLLFAAIWRYVSPEAAFVTGAGLALVAAGLLMMVGARRTKDK